MQFRPRKQEIKSQGYVCPRCKKAFSTLDVLGLSTDPSSMLFLCDICYHSLENNETEEQVEAGKTKIRRLQEQCKTVVDGLKKTNDIVIPSFNIETWLAVNMPVETSASAAGAKGKGVKGEDGIKIATGAGMVNEVKIQMSGDVDVVALQAQRERETEARRVQNKLPDWIAKSTVSGALTAAGIRDAAAMVTESSTITTYGKNGPQKKPLPTVSNPGHACHSYLFRLC